MKIDLNKTISFIIIIVGHLLFLLNVSHNYPMAFITIISTIFIWMFWAKITKLFSLEFLLYLILLSGVFVSISIMVAHGMERVGTRHGNLVDFHVTEIAIAFAVLFITSLPYIILNLKFDLPIKKLNVRLTPAFQKSNTTQSTKQQETQYIIDSDEWELASDNDLQSF